MTNPHHIDATGWPRWRVWLAAAWSCCRHPRTRTVITTRPSTTFALIGDYANVVGRYGPDSPLAQEIRAEYVGDDEFLELADALDRIKRNLGGSGIDWRAGMSEPRKPELEPIMTTLYHKETAVQMTVGALRKALEQVGDDVGIEILDGYGDELSNINTIVYSKRIDDESSPDEKVIIALE